jgi:hypothetical protein
MSVQVPDSLRLINAAEVSSAVVSRMNTTIYPTGGQSYPSGTVGGSVIEFKLPVSANQSIDMSTFYMHFNFQITNKTGATNLAYVQDSIESIFDEVTVFLGNSGQEIERIRNYGRAESAFNMYISDSYTRGPGSSLFACGMSRDERIALYDNGTVTGPTVQFSVPLRLCGVANPSFIMPSHMFGQSSFLIVRVRLASPAACLVAAVQDAITNTSGALTGGAYTASAAQYLLTNVRASFDMIQTSQAYQNQISQFLASSSLAYPVKTWDIDARAIPADVTTQTENLSYNYRDIEAIFFWFNLQSELSNFAFAGEDRLHFPTALESIQLTINGQKVPSVPIDCRGGASEALTHTITALGSLHTAEAMGPFSFPRVQSLGLGYATAVLNSAAYVESSGWKHYGRNVPAGLGLRSLAGAASVANTAAFNPYANDNSPSTFLVGINLRKLLDLPEGELSGLNLQNTSGSIGYELKFTGNHPAYSMCVAVLHNRFISLTGSGVSVDI